MWTRVHFKSPYSLAFPSHRPTQLTVCHCLCPCSPLNCSYELVMYRCQRRHCFPSDIWNASTMAFFTSSEMKQGGRVKQSTVGQRIPPTYMHACTPTPTHPHTHIHTHTCALCNLMLCMLRRYTCCCRMLNIDENMTPLQLTWQADCM